MDNNDGELDARLNRLVSRILQGQCLPFLGAGISVAAPRSHLPTPPGDPGDLLNASAIAARMARALVDHHGSSGEAADAPQGFADLVLRTVRRAPRQGDDGGITWVEQRSLHDYLYWKKIDRACPVAEGPETQQSVAEALQAAEPEVPPLGEVAELCWSVLGPVKTVRLLKFPLWKRHMPTAAHHYLAVLVREGFLTEVLETNYDHFVERAVTETFGVPKAAGAPEPDARDSVCRSTVLHDLASYRAHISQPRDDVECTNLVRVIKLNGCATAWCSAEQAYQQARTELERSCKEHGEESDQARAAKAREEAAHRCVERVSREVGLTEEQLQGWADKRWAQDLLQVRTRGKALFFIGFAGEDPLVRHHVLAVLREFRDVPSDVQATGDKVWWEQNNAPFVMEFAPNLKFAQFQMLRAFRDAHRAQGDARDIYNSAFSGADGPALRQRLGKTWEPSEDDKLPADDLLSLVVSLAMQRHLCEVVLSHQSALHAYLRGALRHPHTTLALIREAVSRSAGMGPTDGPSLWTTWMALENASASAQRASAWGQACYALQAKDAGRAGYRPFLDSPVKQPMLLVMLLLLRRALKAEDSESTYASQTSGPAAPVDDASSATARAALPSASELRQSVVGAEDSGADGAPPPTGVRIVDRDPDKCRRMVLATGHVDAAVKEWTDHPHPQSQPGDLVLVALGRGTTVFREQVRAPIKEAADRVIGTVAVRRLHVIGDLAALRGPDNRDGLSLPEAEANLCLLSRDPGAWTARTVGWQQYCTERT